MNSNAFTRSGTEVSIIWRKPQLAAKSISVNFWKARWKGERGVLPNAKLFGAVWPSVLQYTAHSWLSHQCLVAQCSIQRKHGPKAENLDLLAPSGALIAILTYYWSTTHFFKSHRSSISDFHILSHYSYIKGNHWTSLLATCIPHGYNRTSLQDSAR